MTTTRTRTNEESFTKPSYIRKLYTSKGVLKSTSRTYGAAKCLGRAKKTVDQVTAPKFRRIALKYRRVALPKYAWPYYQYGLPYPHPFQVGDIVGPENTWGFCNLTLKQPANTGYYSYSYEGELAAVLGGQSVMQYLYPITFPVHDSRYTDYTHATAAQNVDGAQVEIGVSLAEIVETATFLINPVKSIVALTKKFGLGGGVFREILRGGQRYTQFFANQSAPTKLKKYQKQATKLLSDGTRVVDESSSYWLAYRFGLCPMLGEIDGYVKLAQEGLTALNGPLLHARSKFEIPNNISESKLETGSTLSMGYTLRVHTQDTYRTDVQFIHKRQPTDILSNLNVFGLHPSQIGTILWEVVPLSFILDRFWNVSAWLDKARPRPGTEILGATHSLKRIRRVELVPTKMTSHTINLLKYEPVEWYSEPLEWLSTSYSRVLAGPAPAMPVWNPRLLDISQYVDHLSLLWQFMPKFWR